MAEDREHALEQALLATVDLDPLGAQEANHRLGGGQANGCHGASPFRSMLDAWRRLDLRLARSQPTLAPELAQSRKRGGHAIGRLAVVDAASDTVERRLRA